MTAAVSSNSIGYTGPIRSAKVSTGVTEIMTRFDPYAYTRVPQAPPPPAEPKGRTRGPHADRLDKARAAQQEAMEPKRPKRPTTPKDPFDEENA
jgi:hypothetical protein